MTKEIWKDIKGYEDYYQVSNLGRVRSLPRETTDKNGRIHKRKGRVLSYKINGIKSSPVLAVTLSKDCKRKTRGVGRLVLETFMGENPNGAPLVVYSNGDKKDLRLDNLQWGNKGKIWKEKVVPTWCKVTPAIAKEIRRLFSIGYSCRELAERFDLSSTTIEDIVAYRVWKVF